MSGSNLLHGLKRKHEAILSSIRAVEKTIKATHRQMESLPNREESVAKLYEDLAHVLAVIRLDHPEYDEAEARPRGKNTFKLPLPIGECTRVAFELLREAKRPMTVNDIARQVLQRAGIEEPEVEELRLACNNVNASFRARLGKTLSRNDEYPQRWWVTGSKAEPVTSTSP